MTLYVPHELSASCWGTTSVEMTSVLSSFWQQLREIVVSGCTLDQLMEKHGLPYYIKCDIEGGDSRFLDMLSRSKAVPDFVSFEVPMSYSETVQCLEQLERRGYRRFYLSDQRIHCELEGKMNSGAFGLQLSDNAYLTKDEFLSRVKLVIWRNKVFGDFSLAEKMRLRRLVRMLESLPVVGSLFYTYWYACHAAK